MSVMVGLDLHEDFTIILICSSFFFSLENAGLFLCHIYYLNLVIPLFIQLRVVTSLMLIRWCQSEQSMQSQEGMRVTSKVAFINKK